MTRNEAIVSDKKIVKTGDYRLINDIEKNGYSKYLSDKDVNGNDSNE